MNRDLLKECTDLLKEPRNNVLRWVADRGDDHVKEAMGSGTQVDQDDFKVAVEQFSARLKAVQEQLDTQVKPKGQKLLIFLSRLVCRAPWYLALMMSLFPVWMLGLPHLIPLIQAHQLLLNPLARAAPTNENVRVEALSEATLLAESFKESTNVLAQALMWGKSSINPAANAMSSVAPSTPLVASTQEHTSASGPWALDQKIKNIEVHLNEVQNGMGVRLTEVQSNFNARQGEVTGMLDRVLAATGAVKAGGAGGVVGVGGVGGVDGVGEASRSPENGGS